MWALLKLTGCVVNYFRKPASGSSSGGSKKAVTGNAASAGMWRFYTEDSPGIKV